MSNSLTLEAWAGVESLNLALVFTDIVDSTAIGQELGDNRWVQELAIHFSRGRDLASRYDCYVVKVIGDAFMVAFRTSTEAVDFAVNFSLDTGLEYVGIRAGVHSGQVRIVDNDIYGLNVNKAARIQSSVEKEGICVSDSIKEDYVKAYGNNSTVKFSLSGVAIKNFKNIRLWRVRSRDLIHAYIEMSKKRKKLLRLTSPSQESPTANVSNVKSEIRPFNPKLSGIYPRLESPTHDAITNSDVFKKLISDALKK